MRELLDDGDNTDVSKFVGIALGVAGGIIILTGIIWFLYQRYGDIASNLTGIPPERKMLVFTDIGRLPDSAQRSPSRPNTARPPSRARLSAAAASAALTAAAPPPIPGSLPSPRTSRTASAAGRPGGPLLPALSAGLEADPLPSTPGSIASPRGHGRTLFSTMDHHNRISHTGGGAPAAAGLAAGLAAGGGGGGGTGEDSRPGSSSAQQGRGGTGSRAGSRGGTLDGCVSSGGERPGSGGTGGGRRPSSAGSGATAGGRARGTSLAAAAAAPALPPALVPTGSVTTAWKGPTAAAAPDLGPERSLNSLAAGTTTSPVETFDPLGAVGGGAAGPTVVSISNIGAPLGTTGIGRPPLPYRYSASGAGGTAGSGISAPIPAAVAAAAAGSLAASSSCAASPVKPYRTSRSRPGSGNDGAAAGGASAGGGGGGSPVPAGSPARHQRPNGVRTSIPSVGGAGRASGTGIPEDTLSGASSQCQSFSCNTAEEAGAARPSNPLLGSHQQHPHPLQQQQQAEVQSIAAGSAAAAAAAAAAAGAAAGSCEVSASNPTSTPPARSRLGGGLVNISASSSQGSVLGFPAAPPAAWSAVYDNGDMKSAAAAVTAVPPAAKTGDSAAAASLPPASVAVTVAAAAGAAEEITEVEPVGGRGWSDGLAAGSSANGVLGGQIQNPASVPSGGEVSSQHTSPTQAAWAAAVSLSSKLFGRGSRTGTPAAQEQRA